MSSEKILVIGATGNNGFRVAKGLLEKKRAVVVAARAPNKQSAELKSLGAEVVDFDFNKPDTVSAAVKGVHSIFLLAPFVENSMNHNKLVIDAAKAAGVKFILRFSAAGADEKATQHVVKDHGLADSYLKASGIDYAILNPTFFFTNYEWQAGTIKGQGILLGSSGTTKYNSIHPDDIADVAIAILNNPSEHKGQSYLLTGSSEDVRSGAEVATLIGQSIGKELKFVDLEAEAYQANLQKYGTPAWSASDITFLEQVKRNGYASQTTDHVKKITGKEPRTFANWLAAARSLFLEEKKEGSGRILVTGATGTNGSRLTKGLLEKKQKVVVGVRDPKGTQAEEFKKLGAEVVEFNYEKPETVSTALKDITSLFLLVPLVEKGVHYTTDTVDAAKKAGVKFILVISALGADAKASAHIAQEHGIGDDYVRASGVNYSILKPTFFFTNFLHTPIKQKSVFTGASGGSAKYTVIDPDDIADISIEILTNTEKHKDTTYLLTGQNESLSDNEIAQLFTKILGKEVKYVDQTTEAFGEQLGKFGFAKWLIEDLTFLQNVKKNGWATETNDNIKKLTGHEPRTLESWIEANKAAFL